MRQKNPQTLVDVKITKGVRTSKLVQTFQTVKAQATILKNDTKDLKRAMLAIFGIST